MSVKNKQNSIIKQAQETIELTSNTNARSRGRLTARGIEHADKAQSVAIEKFSRINFVKTLGLLASRKFILTKVDGQKVFINKKSFQKSDTIDKTYLMGLARCRDGFSKGDLVLALLDLKHSPLDTADKTRAVQFKSFNETDTTGNHRGLRTAHTFQVMRSDGRLQIDKVKEVLGQGSFGKVSELQSGFVLKESAVNPNKITFMAKAEIASHLSTANKNNKDEVLILKTLQSRFKEKYPHEKPVAIEGGLASEVIEITRGPKKNPDIGFLMKKHDQNLTAHQNLTKWLLENDMQPFLANSEQRDALAKSKLRLAEIERDLSINTDALTFVQKSLNDNSSIQSIDRLAAEQRKTRLETQKGRLEHLRSGYLTGINELTAALKPKLSDHTLDKLHVLRNELSALKKDLRQLNGELAVLKDVLEGNGFLKPSELELRKKLNNEKAFLEARIGQAEQHEAALLEDPRISDSLKLFRDQTLLIAFQTIKGLSQMHSIDIFHRDIKPDNIMLTQDEVHFIDFGLASDVQSTKGAVKGLGTPNYFNYNEQLNMPNHQTDEAKRVALGKADVLALGLTLFETMNFGAARYGHISHGSGHILNFNDQREPKAGVREILGEEFVDLVIEMTNVDAAKRPTSEQALERLSKILESSPKLKAHSGLKAP